MKTPLISGLNYPGALALDGSGHLYVSNLYSVGEYTTSGATVNASLIPSGHNSGRGLALDGNGNLLWANNYSNVIAEYTTSGQLENASFITGLASPMAIVIVPEPSLVALMSCCGATALCMLSRKPRPIPHQLEKV